jgi:hypothetical protein
MRTTTTWRPWFARRNWNHIKLQIEVHPVERDCIPIAVFILSIFFSACTGPETFYVSADGDDANSGISIEEAWKTIQRVSGQDFEPGDRVLFRGGDTFTGTLRLTAEDAGTGTARLVLSSFGNSKALISGMDSEGLRADSCHNLTIESLNFCGSGRLTGNSTDGLVFNQCDGLVITDVEVSGFQHSGIHVIQCDSTKIRLVHAHDNGFAGIHVCGTTVWDTVCYDNHNLYIGYCVAENNPGDPTVLSNHSGNGILASSVKGGTIEYCEAFNNGWDMPWTGNGPAGIWIWDCTDFTIQHCISHHNRTNPEAADGGGFDLDGGVSNSVIQYCIAHNNEGAGFGLYEFGAAKTWEDNTIRYNISQDDGIINGGSVGIWKHENQGLMRNCLIYNNTFYNSLEDGSNIWLYDNYPGYQFYNNVFIYNGSLLSEGQNLEDEIFQGNVYWNLKEDEVYPALPEVGSLKVTDPLSIGKESLFGYIPRPGSPLVDKGIDLEKMLNVDPGGLDLLGTSLPKGNFYDIGAIELEDL